MEGHPCADLQRQEGWGVFEDTKASRQEEGDTKRDMRARGVEALLI